MEIKYFVRTTGERKLDTSFRQISYTGLACEKTIKGQGLDGDRQAIEYLVNKYNSENFT